MRKFLIAFLLIVSPFLFSASLQAAGYRAVHAEVEVKTNALAAWTLWTTDDGFQSFFPAGGDLETNIDLRPGGPYEVFILHDNPPGERGCDDCRILGYQEGRMLSFTWTNRPDMAVRPHHTQVVVTFEPIDEDLTRVSLVADGWGEGSDWDLAYAYFQQAWSAVLQSYKARIESGR